MAIPMALSVERAKISQGNQVVVPSKIREKFDLVPGDEIIWAVVGDEVHIRFLRKRKRSLSRLIGKIDMGPTSPEDVDRVVSSR